MISILLDTKIMPTFYVSYWAGWDFVFVCWLVHSIWTYYISNFENILIICKCQLTTFLALHQPVVHPAMFLEMPCYLTVKAVIHYNCRADYSLIKVIALQWNIINIYWCLRSVRWRDPNILKNRIILSHQSSLAARTSFCFFSSIHSRVIRK